jgi:hypothetical protein
MGPELGQLFSGDGLNDVMDMDRCSASVGPQTVVDLLGLDQLSGNL